MDVKWKKPNVSEFLDNLKKWKKDNFMADKVYALFLKERKGMIDQPEEITNFVTEFLMLWGQLGRTILPLRKDKANVSNLKSVLKDIVSDISDLKDKKLLTAKLDNSEELIIKKSFEKHKEVYGIGSTAISKILHLLQPEFFMLWDEKIVKKYKQGNPQVNPNANGYFEFHKIMKELAEWILEEDAEKKIEEELGMKPLTKLLDEFNMLISRPKNKK